MARAATLVVGEHDFTSFAAVDPERGRGELVWDIHVQSRVSDPVAGRRPASSEAGVATVSNVRRIFSSSWERLGEEFVYTVCGSGFLHHMVRNLVGTFILVGKGTLPVEDVTRILDARNRSAAGATAPASGLYLINVEY
jgi:tRNA pseudouridine38-40 synthase